MTIRPDNILHAIPVCEWTEEERLDHLRKTFEIACRDFPDVMERHAIGIADVTDRSELKSAMRAALRETFGQRSYLLNQKQDQAA